MHIQSIIFLFVCSDSLIIILYVYMTCICIWYFFLISICHRLCLLNLCSFQFQTAIWPNYILEFSFHDFPCVELECHQKLLNYTQHFYMSILKLKYRSHQLLSLMYIFLVRQSEYSFYRIEIKF